MLATHAIQRIQELELALKNKEGQLSVARASLDATKKQCQKLARIIRHMTIRMRKLS